MAQNVKPGLRERKRIETRTRIAEEAVRLVSEHGIPSTTVDEIAEAAGVSRATFFRYFESKEAVLFGDWRRHLDVLHDRVSERPRSEAPLEAARAEFQSPDQRAMHQQIRVTPDRRREVAIAHQA